MFLRPFGLYCSACFGSLFVSILCTYCSHFSWYCCISFTVFCAPVFCLIHWFFSLSSFVLSFCISIFLLRFPYYFCIYFLPPLCVSLSPSFYSSIAVVTSFHPLFFYSIVLFPFFPHFRPHFNFPLGRAQKWRHVQGLVSHTLFVTSRITTRLQH